MSGFPQDSSVSPSSSAGGGDPHRHPEEDEMEERKPTYTEVNDGPMTRLTQLTQAAAVVEAHPMSTSSHSPNTHLLLHQSSPQMLPQEQHHQLQQSIPVQLAQREQGGEAAAAAAADSGSENVIVEYVALEDFLMENGGHEVVAVAPIAGGAYIQETHLVATTAAVSIGHQSAHMVTSALHPLQQQQQQPPSNPLPVQVVRPQQPPMEAEQERRKSKRQQTSRNSFSSTASTSSSSSSPSSHDDSSLQMKQEYLPLDASEIAEAGGSGGSGGSASSRRKPRNPIPSERKDDKYWKRRVKNNMAAKRSREAKRDKENQLTMRAQFLEREHRNLMLEMERARSQNQELRERLSRYEKVDGVPTV